MTIKNRKVTAEMPMLIHVHVTIALRLPCFPAYFAPTTANRMDGIMLMTVSIVEIPMFPMTIPNSRVEITDWLAVCCAILSEALEIM